MVHTSWNVGAGPVEAVSLVDTESAVSRPELGVSKST